MFSLTPWKKRGNGKGLAARDYPLNRMREEFETLFDQFFGRWPMLEPEFGKEAFWELDLEDHEKEFVLRAEAPGFEPDDFDVRISGNFLTIRAEHKKETKEKKCTYMERGEFERSLTLPAGVDADKVSARYRSGVLELHLPKTEKARTKQIPVKK